MEWAWALVTIGGVTLGFNVGLHFLGGEWRLSGRLTSIETGMIGVRDELKKLSDVLVKMAEMRGDYRLLDQRLTAAEEDIRDLRHGDGFLKTSAQASLGSTRNTHKKEPGRGATVSHHPAGPCRCSARRRQLPNELLAT